MSQFLQWFQSDPLHSQFKTHSIEAVLALAEAGATIPFMARYRKEQTGNLDEVQIASILNGKEKWDQVLARQKFILEEITSQGKMTEDLKKQISSTFHLDQLEDLYLPYKKKRKTKAQKAREAGLEELANWIWNCGHGLAKPEEGQTLVLWSETFKNEALGYPDGAAALTGACDILIEKISEEATLRDFVRKLFFERGFIKTAKAEKAKEHSKYEKYFSYQESVKSLLDPKNSHRYLAIRRGWIEEELKLEVGASAEDNVFETELVSRFESHACSETGFEGAEVLFKAARVAYRAHVFPSIEREVHRELKEIADITAIDVFAENVQKVLLFSPLGPKCVLGIDPGIRTGCKVAVVDASGKYVTNFVLHLESETGKEDAKKNLPQVITAFQVSAVAVGNGTAGRETEVFIREVFKQAQISIPVVMVSESGASIYSASEVAREEFPNLDLTVRGAISIARRLQDPLAELVKLDPKSIGVGQYQHDVNPTHLKKRLDLVVETCVNKVGVNLNTASMHLLAHVSGVGAALAKSIVEYRGKKGIFKSRKDLSEVPYFTDKAYELSSGFLRVPESENMLDHTGVHPERYGVLEKYAEKLQKKVSDFLGAGAEVLKKSAELKAELGEFTFKDVIAELEKPGRDPRSNFVPVQFRDDIKELSDLKPGLICPGIVTNVTNFGAFVDIGVHQDGLVHISELADRFVSDPNQVVSPGDLVKATVLAVNLEKNQISLSLKTKGAQKGMAKADVGDSAQRSGGARNSHERDRDRGRNDRPKHAAGPRDPGRGGGHKPAGGGRSSSPQSSGGGQQRGGGAPRKPQTPFNNPFAALADKYKK